jgi:hypothetical protein
VAPAVSGWDQAHAWSRSADQMSTARPCIALRRCSIDQRRSIVQEGVCATRKSPHLAHGSASECTPTHNGTMTRASATTALHPMGQPLSHGFIEPGCDRRGRALSCAACSGRVAPGSMAGKLRHNWAECHCGIVNVMNIPDRHLPSEDNWAFRYEVVRPRRGTDCDFSWHVAEFFSHILAVPLRLSL